MQLSAFPSLLDPTPAAPTSVSPGSVDGTTALPPAATPTDFGALLTTQTATPSPLASIAASENGPRSDGQASVANASPLAPVTTGSPLAPVLCATAVVPALVPTAPATTSAAAVQATTAPLPRPQSGKVSVSGCNGKGATPLFAGAPAQAGRSPVSIGPDAAVDVSSSDDDPALDNSESDAKSATNATPSVPPWMPTALAELRAIVGPGLSDLQFATGASVESSSSDATASDVTATDATLAPGNQSSVIRQAAPQALGGTRLAQAAQVSRLGAVSSLASATATTRDAVAFDAADSSNASTLDVAASGGPVPAETTAAAASASAPIPSTVEPAPAAIAEDFDATAPVTEEIAAPVILSRQATQVQRAFGFTTRAASAPATKDAPMTARVNPEAAAQPSENEASAAGAFPVSTTFQPSGLSHPDFGVNAADARSVAAFPNQTPAVAAPIDVTADAAHLPDASESSSIVSVVSPVTQSALAEPNRVEDTAGVVLASDAATTGARVQTPLRATNARAEKIAATVAAASSGSARHASPAEKTGLLTSDEQVTSSAKPLGINVAQAEAPMSAPAHNPAARSNEPLSFVAASAAADAAMKDAGTTASPEIARAATRAVDAALAMAEHFSNGAQRGVSLQFSVSGVDLAVRVEMRADGVHTTFRTDSPELRAALAQEWQNVASSQSADKPLRLTEPVFTSQATNSFSADSGAANQRQPGARQNFPTNPGLPTAFPEARRSSTETTVAAPAPTRWAGLVSTSQHLHTFA